MQNRGTWIAFLTMCFALTGLAGLFASYSTSIPFERAMHRLEILDRGLEPSAADAALREAMGRAAPAILESPGDAQAHLARARVAVRQEASEEAAAFATRTRLLVGVVTFLSAALGAGLLMLASRPASF